MTHIQNLSRRDLELLSAYIDGELPDREKQQLRSRLTQETYLSAALNELTASSKLLKALPAVRAPRDFTLTPEMVGVSPRRSFSTFFWPMATAAAALAFVLVTGLDALTGGGFGFASAPALDEAAQFAVEESVGADPAAELPAELAAGAVIEGEEPLAEADVAAEDGAAAERTQGQETDSADLGVAGTAPAEGEGAMSPESEAEENLEAEVLGTATSAPTATLSPTIAPDESFADNQEQVFASRPTPSRASPLRGLQILLAGATVLLFFTTILARRRAK